ncbi:carboxypeptidase regulatory-like domain-containing protein [Pedobacter rhodius]|uniref:Carboxypeptidase-like regulatory domain-containing protein n=1 Tax=Pedobacter rhodius TaxID=3004098 RepID=A0ABT4KVH0_9SPHI|nr:carboxypeptidase regulatory-like domain-containing protein [Pedobacter sp. SJ11]MCZ4222912.1 carboxypeptidase-like regulatory domain-containing protein [Pedobacter sp. SJ11]
MKHILSILFVFAILVSCSSLNHTGSYTKTTFKTKNNNVIVTGTVYDTNKNNRTLPGVPIKTRDTILLTTTDDKGRYRIKLNEGHHILRASYIGYLMRSTRDINLVNGDSVVVDFILKESPEKTIN